MAQFDSKTFNAEVFGKYVERIPDLRKNELLKSGALVSRQELANLFDEQTGGNYATIPMYGLIDGTPINYDGVNNITATSTKTYSQSVVVVGRAKAWTEKDFAYDITGKTDFMSNVAQQVAKYWEDVDQDTLLHILKGIFSMTGTENLKFVNGHTTDITSATVKTVDATTLNNAIQKASGDNKSAFTVAILHSQVATNLENLQVLDYYKYTDENGVQRQLNIGSWNGRTVLVDDSLPVDTTGTNPVYTSYVLGQNAFGMVDCGAKVPYEMYRNPLTNGGQDTLITRRRKAFIPYGISFTKSSMVSLSPTDAELEIAANWSLVNDGAANNASYIDHKSIPIAQIKSEG